MGALERAGMARRRRLGGGRARQPACRVPMERRARRHGRGDRHRRPRRVDGLRSCSRRWRVEALLEPATAADVDGSLEHGRRLRVLHRPAGRRSRTRTGHLQSKVDRVLPVRTGLRGSTKCSARCTAETSIATSSSLAWSSGTAPIGATGWRPTSTVSRSRGTDRGGSRTHRGVAARRARQPVLDSVLALDRRRPSPRPAPRQRRCGRGLAFVREHRVQFEAHRAANARWSIRRRTRGGVGAVRRSHHGLPPRCELIITLASVPALFERLDRFEAATLLGAMF